MKVLVVDDKKDTLEAIEAYLNDLGYEVVTAENGREAIEKCDNSFDLLITDRRMPRMLGEELIRRIKQLYPKIRAILMTAEDLDDGIKRVITAAGASAILLKPFDLNQVNRILQSLERRE